MHESKESLSSNTVRFFVETGKYRKCFDKIDQIAIDVIQNQKNQGFLFPEAKCFDNDAGHEACEAVSQLLPGIMIDYLGDSEL